jgi:protein phosphatase
VVIGYDTIEYASLTDVGIRRSNNQDAHATLLAGDSDQWQERGHIFLVADGMGAHAVGEMASDMAVGIIPHTYHKYALQGGVPALRKAFVEANASIHAKGQQNPEFGGMGTTTTGLLIRPEGAWIGHVGDSRAYRVRDGQIEQLSFDHSLVWEMARRQNVDPDRLEGIPSNVIVRSLGPEPLVQVDVEGPHVIHGGDIFVLCSDGLSGQVADAEIGAIASALPPAEACRFLVDLANLRGGPDNITVLIVRIHERAGRPAPIPKESFGWLRPIPWPVYTLVGGVLLAGLSAALRAQLWPGYKETFLVAAVVIIVGLIGLFVYLGREKRRLANEPPPTRIRVYRHTPCRVERPLLDRLVAAIESLHQQLQEKKWEVDWAAYEEHCKVAKGFLSQDKLVDAFREYCRSIRFLADAVLRQRPRSSEPLPTFWPKQ